MKSAWIGVVFALTLEVIGICVVGLILFLLGVIL